MSKIEPKLDIDGIHNELKSKFKGFEYLVLTEDKANSELYVMTDMSKSKVLVLLTDLVNQLENGTTIESYTKSSELKDLNKSNED